MSPTPNISDVLKSSPPNPLRQLLQIGAISLAFENIISGDAADRLECQTLKQRHASLPAGLCISLAPIFFTKPEAFLF